MEAISLSLCVSPY